MNTWQLEEAKRKFSKVVKLAVEQEPQLIVRQGEKVVVVLSYREYEKLKMSRSKLSEFFRTSPLAKIDLALSRDKGILR